MFTFQPSSSSRRKHFYLCILVITAGLFFLTGCGTVPAPGSEALFTPAKELQPLQRRSHHRPRALCFHKLRSTTSRPKKRLLSP